MMRVGIGCDNYKRKTFEEMLTDAGYSFAGAQLTPETYLLQVEIEPDQAEALRRLVEKMDKAARCRRHN